LEFVLRIEREPLRSVRYLLMAVMLSTLTLDAAAAAGGKVLPAHARASRYGGGWDCLRGFEVSAGACVLVKIPAHGYLAASGNDWECSRGYLKVQQSCQAFSVPVNGHANDSAFGPGWKCDRGFREANGGCARIAVPANAFAVDASYGSGWECSRGYRTDGNGCVAVAVPANGFLVRAGVIGLGELVLYALSLPASRSAYPRTDFSMSVAMAGVVSAAIGRNCPPVSPWPCP
jgi:hypothetical protein